MEIAIVGLARSGKTTVFNTLTRGEAETGGFGGMTVNVGVVKVPDERLTSWSPGETGVSLELLRRMPPIPSNVIWRTPMGPRLRPRARRLGGIFADRLAHDGAPSGDQAMVCNVHEGTRDRLVQPADLQLAPYSSLEFRRVGEG